MPAIRTKVLLLDTNDAMGGVVRVHVSLARELDRCGFDLYVACLGYGHAWPLFRELPETHRWTIAPGTKSRRIALGRLAALADVASALPLAWTVLRLAYLCRRAGVQVIHTSDKRRAVMLSIALHRLTGIPFLYHSHNRYVDFAANRQALVRAAAIVSVAAEMKADFVHARGHDMERIRVIHNGVNTSEFRTSGPADLRAELGVPADAMLIGITSRLAPDKGQEAFLRAASRVAAQEPRAWFIIVGDDAIASDNADYVPRLRQLAADAGLAARTRFLGGRRDMASIYRSLDVVVNAAHCEACCMVLLEAMACGRAVIGSRAGGTPEIVTHDQDGLLFDVDDAADLAEQMLRLARDPARRARLGAAARATIESRFSISVQTRAIERIYTELAAKASAS